MNTSIGLILGGLQSGLPVLIGHFAAALALLIVGAFCYIKITPFNERQLIAQNNVAAACVLVGTLVALAIPLTATLATSGSLVISSSGASSRSSSSLRPSPPSRFFCTTSAKWSSRTTSRPP